MSYSYKFDTHGTFVLTDAGGYVIARHDPSASIAIFHDEGALMKHGNVEGVRAHFDTTRAALAKADPSGDLTSGFELIELPVEIFRNDAALEELNLALNCSGRVAFLRVRIAELCEDRLGSPDPA